MHAVDVETHLLDPFNAGDLDRMRELLAPDLVAWVTNADGEADRVAGRDEYLSRIAAMDLPGAQYRVTLTQSPAVVDEHLVGPGAAGRPTAAQLRSLPAPGAGRSSQGMGDGRRQAR